VSIHTTRPVAPTKATVVDIAQFCSGGKGRNAECDENRSGLCGEIDGDVGRRWQRRVQVDSRLVARSWNKQARPEEVWTAGVIITCQIG